MALELNYSEIGLYARKSSSLYELSMALLTIIENVGENIISRQAVLITASGLLG